VTIIENTLHTDILPDYGVYKYKITAVYTENRESGAAIANIQWGDAHISVSPLSLLEHLIVDEQATQYISVANTGQLDLDYSITVTGSNVRSPDDYCDAFGGSGFEYISRVQLGDIDNVTGDSSYYDYTNLVVSMQSGESYPITVTNGSSYDLDQCGVWIDWDGNSEFDEEMIVMEGSPGNGPYTANISTPLFAKTGLTRMRVRLMYTGDLDPCGETDYGEVEDYGVFVQSWFNIDPVIDTIQPGDTKMIAVNFDASNMAIGTYSALAKITSNDPDANEVTVDITLNVSETMVAIEANQEVICKGESSELRTTVSGMSGELTYLWYSNPEGFIGETSNVEVSPAVPTWYHVIVTNGHQQSCIDSIFIEVLPLPVVSIGEDTSICSPIIWTLDAGNPGSTYKWSTGETTQTVDVDYNGVFGEKVYSVEVTNELSCVNTAEITINWLNCSSINETNSQNTFTVFPNPASSAISLQFMSISKQISVVEIYDQNGKLWIEKQIPVGTDEVNIDVRGLKDGVYNCRLFLENNSVTKKLIIRR